MTRTLDWEKYREKAAAAVSEGIVLIKNDNAALPLDKDKPVAIFGRIQLDYYKSGTGSGGMVNVSHVVNIPEGLKICGVTYDEEVYRAYESWTKDHPFDQGEGWGGEPWCQEEMPLPKDFVRDAADRSDTAIVIIGRTAGEEMDNSNTEGSYLLTAGELEMLKITRRYFKKQIVLLNTASVIDMGFVDETGPDSVLYVWHGGMEGGLGTADVLVGNASPSGRLTDTIAYNIEDYPSHPFFGSGNRDFYSEDIYVGYRYFETFAPEKVKYPFGYGLSYTCFEYSDIECVTKDFYATGGDIPDPLSGEGRKITVSVTITNTGKYAGKEIAQVYCEAPQGLLGKPSKVLCGFEKTHLLQSGESETLTISLDPMDFASFDDEGLCGHRYAFILEAGKYTFHVGKNVRDTAAMGSVIVKETYVLQQLESALPPVLGFDRMVNEGGRPVFKPAPINEPLEGKRRIENMPRMIPMTGDLGIKLKDVYEGKNSLSQFIAQLSEDDLNCLVRGEGMGSPKVTAGTASAFGGVSKRLSDFGIPCVCCSDGPSGMRLDCGTKAFSLPGGTLLACSFNRELVTELFGFTGLEMSANHVECLLGPGMNIHRHPLNGRNFEYFSEDPFVTGQIAAAELKGLHGAGVTGTIKHFCGNNRETGRHFLDSVISERALREIYLKGFYTAVKQGGAYTVMTTYGSVNGLWTAGSYDLDTTILRKEWGFKGMVMTDWWANINRRGEEPDKTDLAAMVMAQNDVYMVCPDGGQHNDNIKASLAKGELEIAELQRAAENVLTVVLRTNAMKRLTRDADTVTITGRPGDGEEADREVSCYELENELTVDLTGVKAQRDTSFSFILDLKKFGRFNYTLTASSEAGELAQIPVTVFFMGTASGTFTFNGTGGKPVSVTGSAFMFSRYTTVRMYFAQGGLKLSSISFKYEKQEENG